MLAEADLPSLKWVPADEQGVVDFLVGEKNFSEERVRKTVQKMNASRSKANQGAPGWVLWLVAWLQQQPAVWTLLLSDCSSWSASAERPVVINRGSSDPSQAWSVCL